MNYIFRELRRHVWRTVTGIAGYAIAIMFILLVISFTIAKENSTIGILKSTGTHFIVYIPSNTSCCKSDCAGSSDGSLVAEGVYTLMLNSDVIGSIKEIDGVKDAAPYILYKIFDEKYQTFISLGGIDTSSIATGNNVCAQTNLVSGKYLSGKADEVLAEESFAIAQKLSYGDTITTYGGNLVVAGIVNSGIKPGKADLYGPIQNVRTILKEKLNCISDGFDMNIVLVEVSDARLQKRVMNELKQKMNYLAFSSYNCYQPASEVMSIMEGSSTIITVITFIFLVIFAAKTQLTSLIERFREIGILKSLGWSDNRLCLQVISVSLLQALAGALIGIISGILLMLLVNSLKLDFEGIINFRIQVSRIPVLIFLSLAGGLIAGIFPILRLLRSKAGEMINNYL